MSRMVARWMAWGSRRPGFRGAHALVVVWIAIGLVGAATPAEAGTPLDWGPGWSAAALHGADVRSLEVDPGAPDTVFAGTASGHVDRSDDGGVTWRPAGPPVAFPGWVVSALRFDPNRPGRLWAGLWGVWGGGLVAYSEDFGASWTYLQDGLPSHQVYSLALVPGRPGHLYIGTRNGVYASRDDGVSWSHATAALPKVQKVTSLLVDARRPDRVLAGTWRRVYRSEDAGVTWGGVFTGMDLDREVFSLSPVPGRPGEVWASTCGWVYRSLDDGATWKRFQQGLSNRRTPSFRPMADGPLLAGTVGGLFASTDGGRSWERRSGPDLAVHAIGYHPARPDRVLLGTEGSGVWRSDDGARSFRRSSRGQTNVWVTGMTRTDDALLVAASHAGPASGIYRSRDGGRSFVPDGDSPDDILDLLADRNRVFAATEEGLYRRVGTAAWQRVDGVPAERVEFLRDGGAAVEVQTSSGRFVEGAAGRFREAEAVGQSTAVPLASSGRPAPGELVQAGPRTLLIGPEGVWVDQDGAGGWRRLAEGALRPLISDGGPWALLLGEGHRAFVFESGVDRLHSLELPVPARSVSSLVLAEDELLLATHGYGLLRYSLEALTPSSASGAAHSTSR